MQNSFPGRKRLAWPERARILESYLRSKLSQKEFAVQTGVPVSTLQYWLRKSPSRLDPAAPVFVEVPMTPVLSSAARGYRLHFPKGQILEIPSGFRTEEVQQLWQLLQKP
jgi:hypothetical protein